MSSIFEDLQQGLQEAIEFEKGKGKAKSVTYIITPVTDYDHKEIRGIRRKAGMTQAVFASYMGVSTKTVEAWERGKTHPTGPACRLLNILDSGREKDLSFVEIEVNQK